MNIKSIYVLILVLALTASFINAQQDDFPILKGPYLGQEPPGEVPEYFAPGIISVDENFEHSAAVFSPDGNEVYWCTNVDWYTERGQQGMLRLYFMKIVDGKWTAPEIAPFVKNRRVERPVFSPDGTKLYFESFVDSQNTDDVDIFVVEKRGEQWSEPKPVAGPINTKAVERLHCITADGSMYFTRNLMRSDEEIYVSRFVNGMFTEPEKLGESYNTESPELALVFGPEKKYMLSSVINAQRTSSDLCISYLKADGNWTERIKTPYYCGGFLALSPDGKYLFMLNEGICWVSTSFVENMKPETGVIK